MALTYEPIATTTLGSATTTITFSSVPSTYTDLVIVVNGTTVSANGSLNISFNGTGGTAYSDTVLYGDGTTAGSLRRTSRANITDAILYTNPSMIIYNIMNYSNTTTYKTVLIKSTVAQSELDVTVGLWTSTAAITSISLVHSQNMSAGTTATLYGIKAA